MSKQPLLVTGDAMTDAPAQALLATAAALLREAGERACAGTAGAAREDLIAQIITCQQVQNTAWAAQSVRLAQVVAIEEVTEPGKPAREVRHAVGTYTDEWLPLELSTRLGWSDRQTTTRIEDATDAMRCSPRLFARTMAGGLDARKLTVIADTLVGAGADVATDIEDELLAIIDAAQSDDNDASQVSLSSTKLVRRARRLLAERAPVAAEKSAASRRADAKQVRAFAHHEPGMSVFRAVLPTEDCLRVKAAVEELAAQLHRDTTTGKSLDECRVDAFVDLLLGNASVATTCVLQIPFLPLPAGDSPTDDGPGVDGDDGMTADLGAELAALVRIAVDQGFEVHTSTSSAGAAGTTDATDDSLGPVRVEPRVRLRLGRSGSGSHQRWDPDEKGPPINPCDRADASLSSSGLPAGLSPAQYAQVADAVFEGLGVIPADVLVGMCRTFGTKLTRALVDLRTGATVETADQTYKPGARLRRFVVTRDQHCRFPQCTRPARLDDVDHVIRYPDGSTAAWNLQCLCRHHHRAKHEGGWRVTMTPDGICTWTSPSGRHYVTHPGD